MNDTLADSYRFCDDLARREAKNFYHAFRLLPRDRRAEMSALYAFMRRTDDIADEPGSVDEKRKGLDAWRLALDRSLDGREHAWPGLPALADAVARRGLPPRYLIDVVDGVEMDLTRSTYDTFADLYRYCYRVASAVGLCCLHIWGFESRDGEAETLAEANGIALQLTNIIRDVREDAGNGRVYLPLEDLDRFGVGRAELSTSAPSPALRELLAFEASRARMYYDHARPLRGLVSPVGRPALGVITGIYRALLDEIVKRGYDVMTERVRVPGWRKALIMVRARLGGETAAAAAAPPPGRPT